MTLKFVPTYIGRRSTRINKTKIIINLLSFNAFDKDIFFLFFTY